MRFIFDTSVLIDYLRDPNDTAADALFIAAERGQAFCQLISLMELYLPTGTRSRTPISENEIETRGRLDIDTIFRSPKSLNEYGIRVIPCSTEGAWMSLTLCIIARSR